MSKRQPEYQQRGYLLPDNLDPPQVPICICIPCDRNHALAFLGQLEMLGYWWTWERDDDKRGKDAARVWRQIAADARAELEKCGVFTEMGCGCEEQRIERQFIGDDGHLYVEYQDGTIERRDDLDPRFSNPILPPMPGENGAVKRCVAANSAVTALQELQQDEYEALLAGTNLAQALYNIIVAFVGIVIAAPVLLIPGIIALLITALVNIIADMLPEDFDNAFTEQTWQDLLCILYCEMSEDGSFTDGQWAIVIDRVVSEIGGFAGITWLHDTINMMGAVGLTNAARSGYGGSRDCSGCDCSNTWCYTFNFPLTDGDWQITESYEVPFGSYDLGSGWSTSDDTNVQTGITTAHRQMILRRTFEDATLTRVLVTFDYTGGTFDNNTFAAFVLSLNGTAVITNSRGAMVDGDDQTREWTNAGVVRNQIDISIRSSRDITAPYSYSGSALLTSVRVEGTGVNPFGEDNCEE